MTKLFKLDDIVRDLQKLFSETQGAPALLNTPQRVRFAKFVEGISNPREPKSKSARYARERALQASSDIYHYVSVEAFVLCAVQYTMSAFATLPYDGLVNTIHTWWNSVEHPVGMARLTRDLCEEYSLDTLLKQTSPGSK